jgi:hypothetical protein
MTDLEVQMRPRASARAPDLGDRGTLPHVSALVNQDAAVVGVDGQATGGVFRG